MPGATPEFRKILRHCAGVLPQIKIATACFLLFKLGGLKHFKAEALQRSTPNIRDSEEQRLLLYTIFQTREPTRDCLLSC